MRRFSSSEARSTSVTCSVQVLPTSVQTGVSAARSVRRLASSSAGTPFRVVLEKAARRARLTPSEVRVASATAWGRAGHETLMYSSPNLFPGHPLIGRSAVRFKATIQFLSLGLGDLQRFLLVYYAFPQRLDKMYAFVNTKL